jgi:gliding motility-associated-like protein
LPYTYSWGTTPPQASLTATGLAAGDYPFYLIDANGCKSFALQTIQQPESLSFTANQTNVRCYGNASGTATIHVQGGTIPYQYAWTGSTLNQNSIDGLLAGNYTVAVTDAHGCTISNNYTITQPFEPIDIVLSADSVTCFGSSDGQGHVVAFGGTPPYTYTWNSSPQQYGTTATGLLGKNYTVTVKDANNCLYNKSVLIPSPLRIKTSVLDKQNAYCNLANGWITTGSLNGFPPYTYSWSPVAGNTASLTNIPEGTYEVFVTDKKGCEDSLTTVITNTPPPVADFTSNPTNLDPTFLNQANFTFTNQSTGQIASYLWNFGDNTTANSYNATHTYNDSGVYVVTLVVFDRNGACPDTARSTYTILPNGEIFTPNVFSPNDDGHNDDFFVSGNGVKTMNCIIYDRWGREIKVLTQLFETWNGKDGKGLDVPEGTYIFKIEATLNDGRVLKRGGSVIVIR